MLKTLPEQSEDIRQQEKSDEGCVWKGDVFTGKFRRQSGGGGFLHVPLMYGQTGRLATDVLTGRTIRQNANN